MPGVGQPAFQLAVVYDAFATGNVTVELGLVLSYTNVVVAGLLTFPALSVARTRTE
jgi:hypothetical protein